MSVSDDAIVKHASPLCRRRLVIMSPESNHLVSLIVLSLFLCPQILDYEPRPPLTLKNMMYLSFQDCGDPK